MNTNKEIKPIKISPTQAIRYEDVAAAYIGRAGLCMCGCSGTYYYTTANKAYASKDRGFTIQEEKINEDKVKEVFLRVAKAVSKDIHDVENIDNYIFTVEVGKMQYTLYLIKGAL